MPNPHTLVPVGMMGVQTNRDNLGRDLKQIFEGDITFAPEACNSVHAYQEPNQVEQPPPQEKWRRALSQYTNLVSVASQQSGGRLKCLVGDLTQKSGEFWFYDQNMNPDTAAVNSFVTNFIDDIMNRTPPLTNNVLAWYLADEVRDTGGSCTKPSLSQFTTICQAAHNAQIAKQTQGWPLKPFYIVIPMDANWAADLNNINFCSYVDPWVNAVTNTVGADLVIMIDFYPWLSTAEDFRFSQSPEKEAFRSPLRRWWKFLHDTGANYANNTKVVGVHAVLQAHRMDSSGNPHPDTFRIPSHADMHQQIRAVRNFMGESGSKPAGIWLWGWGRGADVDTPTNNVMACKRWTQANTELWAEAVQNEIDNQTEGTGGAIPPDSTVLQSLPPSFPPYNRSTKLGGAWITFRLHQRGLVEFTIKQGAVEKRRLSWEYNYNSVQQNAVNTVSCPPGQVDKLGAVAIFFDGRDSAGNNLPAGAYTCQMMVNGATVGCVIGLTIE